jgi:hypothetical protein
VRASPLATTRSLGRVEGGHAGHGVDVVRGAPPVDRGLEVAQRELARAAGGELDHAVGHAPREEPGRPERRLVVEEDRGRDPQPVPLAVQPAEVQDGELREPVEVVGLGPRLLVLGRRGAGPEDVARAGQEDPAGGRPLADGLEEVVGGHHVRAQEPALVDGRAGAAGVLAGEVEAQVGRLLAHEGRQRRPVRDVEEAHVRDGADPGRGLAARDADHLVAAPREELGQERPVLAADAGDEDPGHLDDGDVGHGDDEPAALRQEVGLAELEGGQEVPGQGPGGSRASRRASPARRRWGCRSGRHRPPLGGVPVGDPGQVLGGQPAVLQGHVALRRGAVAVDLLPLAFSSRRSAGSRRRIPSMRRAKASYGSDVSRASSHSRFLSE